MMEKEVTSFMTLLAQEIANLPVSCTLQLIKTNTSVLLLPTVTIEPKMLISLHAVHAQYSF